MKRIRKWTFGLAGFILLFAGITPQDVDAQVRIGAQSVLWDFDKLGIGARLDFGLANAFAIEDGFFGGLFGSVNASRLFDSEESTFMLINANGNLSWGTDQAVRPYAGTGINVHRESIAGLSRSSVGLNLLGGLFFDLGSVPAFGEIQYSTTDSGFLSLSGGVLLGR